MSGRYLGAALGRLLLAIVVLLGALGALAACSLDNQEGPDVSCADLQCGRINACKEGIIAQCVDGVTVRYHVCKSTGDDVCDEDWQKFGEFRCLEFETDCEGCRPERVDGCDTTF